MNKNLEKWIEKQSEALFKGAGAKPSKKVAKQFTLVLALPFFFVPVLIAGYVVAEVGETVSKQAVVFLRSQEVKPEKTLRVMATHKAPSRKSMVVTHTVTPSDFEAQAKP